MNQAPKAILSKRGAEGAEGEGCGEGRPPYTTGGPGKRCELPQRGPGQAEPRKLLNFYGMIDE